ncbi:DNA-binding IclR family transcriptional regulator [Actinoplanes campanulatus]|uniref:DNA-binding IclR family transcriptional regulator n=1 Tax=Actinoplanes campanulatus TaxID=113559 RepID=A0A7W5FET8_9ACTN|nr:IclR family transcriptional regulator [Actinoplanes campanulatus]MBB3095756.1 DNA-binding IclR family transcriptional regulator [Actinoplanes campanulatus]GGN11297.1 transcriptional regulator [Actinoplanes campanulatus]GID36653.1 transcriptional regulator [Actinoplanes campanulatus]
MARVVPAVIRALDILELFLDRAELSAREVTERLGLPRTTVHELLVTLVERAYLIAVPGQPVRYRLGMPLFQLGSAFAGRLDLVREARSIARDVAAACDEAVHVAVLDGADVVYLVKVDSTHPVRMVSAVGRRLPAHCTAVGKILLAGLDRAGLDAVLAKGPLAGMTPASITDPNLLRAHLEQVRGEGVAADLGESDTAMRCVAAAVRDHSGAIIAAMSVSAPAIRWTPDAPEKWTDLVREGASALSACMGHRTASR